MKIKARLLPLEGKYYGTGVELTYPGETHSDLIKVWVMGNHKPSSRELEAWPEEYGEYEIMDSHYETETGLKIAKAIVKVVNDGL